jgi:hypothetical protein
VPRQRNHIIQGEFIIFAFTVIATGSCYFELTTGKTTTLRGGAGTGGRGGGGGGGGLGLGNNMLLIITGHIKFTACENASLLYLSKIKIARKKSYRKIQEIL